MKLSAHHHIKVVLPLFISIFLVLVAFISYMITLTDYGPTWDEFFHAPNGKRYYEFLKTGDLTEIFSNPLSSWLPPVSSTIGWAFIDNTFLSHLYPFNADRFHMAAILYGSVTVGAVFIISYIITKNIFLSLLASTILMLHPQFITQSHTNVRDMGLVMFYTMTIAAFLMSLRGEGSVICVVASGILAGLATDSKQNGAFLVIIGFLWYLIHIRQFGWKKIIFGYALFLSVFIITFFLFWPYLWADTFVHLKEAWVYLRSPSILGGNLTFYDTVYYSMKDIPFYYPWAMLFLTTPPLIGILSAVGLVWCAKSIISKSKQEFLLYLWITIPLIRFLIPASAIAHDQIRHFLEVLPSIPIFFSLTLWHIYNVQIKTSRKYIKYAVIIISILSLIYLRYIDYVYEPFGTAYFNIFAGSGKYVTHAFDVEYWGNVYREAVEYLNMTHGKYAIYYNPGLGSHLLQEDGLQGILTEDLYRHFDYVIFMNKQNWIRDGGRHYIRWLLATKKPIFTIERQGKILFYQFKPYKEEYLLYSMTLNKRNDQND